MVSVWSVVATWKGSQRPDAAKSLGSGEFLRRQRISPWFGSPQRRPEHRDFWPWFGTWRELCFLVFVTSVFLSVLLVILSSVTGLSVPSLFSMGASQSRPATPLQCVLGHFRDVYSKEKETDYGVRFTRARLRALCEIDWPSFNVNWPSSGTFNSNITRAVWDIVLGQPGHPDQFPYINV